jgi:hypothetical protein
MECVLHAKAVQGMPAEEAVSLPDAADPPPNEASILPGGQMLIATTATWEQTLSRLWTGDP